MKKLLFTVLGIAAITTAAAQTYTPQLPEAAAFIGRGSGRETLPAPKLEIGTTTITVHLANFNGKADGMLSLGDPFSGEPKPLAPAIDGNTLTFTFEQYATQRIAIYLGTGQIRPIVNPGDNVEVWVDLKAMDMHVEASRKAQPSLDFPYAYYGSGDFMAENNVLTSLPSAADIMANATSGIFSEVQVPIASVEDFVRVVVENVEGRNAAVDAMPGVSGAVKEALKLDDTALGLCAVANMKSFLQLFKYAGSFLLTDNIKSIAQIAELDPNNPKLLYGGDFYPGVIAIAKALYETGATDVVATTGEPGWMQWGGAFTALAKARDRQPLTADDTTALAAAPEYLDMLQRLFTDRIEKQYSSAVSSGTFTINPTPEYADPADLIELIAARYPGKVVFVDFWATWCGPCLGAMKVIKPLKPWMKEQGIVSVYITGESSPATLWTLSLPDIGGEHYYLTREEWNAMCLHNDIKGIPTYMIFDREGKMVYRKTSFPGNETLQAEFEKYL